MACCFIGHRDIVVTEELILKLKKIIEDLIVNYNVSIFLFGSRSEFDTLCYDIVTELKNNYPNIKRINYTCKSEACILESERKMWEERCSRVLKKEIHLRGFEQEIEHKAKYTSGRASYVERNYAMINDSEFCVFYYDKEYNPEWRKYSKRSGGYYQPKSGTRLAYNYAKQKNKNIINVV